MSIIKKYFTRIPLLFAVPFVFLIRLVSPFVLLRIGYINGRIGHLTMDIELSICKRESDQANLENPRKVFDIFYLPKSISNEYVVRLWKRTIRVFPKWLMHPIHRVNQRLPGGYKYDSFNGISHEDLSSLDNCNVHLNLTKREEEDAWKQLEKIGLQISDKYVCLCVRDNKYLATFDPLTDWSEHDIRDSNISDYKLAAEQLVSLGYKVVRMGKAVNEHFPSVNPLIIDYAKNSIRSDFLDVHIFKNASFVISTGTGMDFLGAIFRRPLGLVNVVSPYSLGEGRIVKLYQPQTFFNEIEGKNISLSKLLDLGWNQFTGKSSFIQRSLTPTKNTPEEIRNFCTEFVKKYELGNSFHPDKNVLKVVRKKGILRDKFAYISESWIKAHPEFVESESLLDF